MDCNKIFLNFEMNKNWMEKGALKKDQRIFIDKFKKFCDSIFRSSKENK